MLPLYALLFLSLLVWLPVLFRGIERRGFILLLGWLAVAPIAVNLVGKPGTNPFFSSVAKKPEARADSRGTQGGGYFTHHEASIKLTDFFQPTRVLLGSFVIVFLLNAIVRRKRFGSFDRTEKFAGIFAVLLLASVFFQSERAAFGLRIASDAFIIPFVAYFCARRLVTTEDQLRQLIRVAGSVGIYLIIIGLVERLTLQGLFVRVQGPFDDRNEMYIVMVVVFFMALVDFVQSVFLRKEEGALPRIAQMVLLVFAPLVILLGWSRGNLMGLLLGIWVFVFLGSRLVGFRPKMALVGLVLLLGPIIAVGFYELTPEDIVESRIVRSRTVYGRLGAWQKMFEVGFESPIMGIGLNNLRNVLAENRTRFEGVTSENNPHNSVLSIFAELGVFGLLFYIAIILSIIQSGTNLYRRGSDLRERWRGITVIAIVLAYLVPSLFVNSLYIPGLCHVYVYAYIGAVAGLHNSRRLISTVSSCAANGQWLQRSMHARAERTYTV